MKNRNNTMETPKGEYKGECNRTACTNSNAVFYNHSTLKHYCGECADEINKWAQDFKDETGHELCVKIEPEKNGTPIQKIAVSDIEKLKADKEKMRELLERMKNSFDTKAWITESQLNSYSKEIESLIQKMKP